MATRESRGPYYSYDDGPLRKLRRELGLTQSQAAARYGVTERTWRTWENGEGWHTSALDYARLKLTRPQTGN